MTTSFQIRVTDLRLRIIRAYEKSRKLQSYHDIRCRRSSVLGDRRSTKRFKDLYRAFSRREFAAYELCTQYRERLERLLNLIDEFENGMETVNLSAEDAEAVLVIERWTFAPPRKLPSNA